MINVSTLFDPRYVFLVYAPILFALNKRVAHRLVVALSLTEWTNQILKWLLAGERPYWYAQERAQELARAGPGNFSTGIHSYDAAGLFGADDVQPAQPQLKQFAVTCELGAGSPSGHAMVTATVWYILVEAYLAGELGSLGRRRRRPGGERAEARKGAAASALAWSLYSVALLTVSLSRVYLACHFPHQCACGALLGLLVARLVSERLPMEALRPSHFCLATAFMFGSALATYATLRLLGQNPLWSVDKAMRWCVSKDFIHLDTTPFFSMVRYLGFCLGAGLAYEAASSGASQRGGGGGGGAFEPAGNLHLLARRALVALVSILFGRLLFAIPVPKSNQNLFYLISFATYALFSYSIASPIPRLAKRALAAASKRRAGSSARM